ncbi:hypothetical protein [Bacillus suaedaesalsae]|uniref:Uncharacterized protein n=1 Tax=Bacillus suaedaesalsae TaxID=2810349 RepID=A0ABS2DII8_9BACI|nr:hypothetical protein [Bacillus suaedaesalsae]MBM6618222.1 hypothetical protein [Bacillus suaedaesalsae]
MGVKHFSCDKLALEEIRDALREAKREGLFVALVGDNRNVLGFGIVDDVNDATAELEFPGGSFLGPDFAAIPGISGLVNSVSISNSNGNGNDIGFEEVEFTVNLCCVCSVVSSESLFSLIILGIILGYIPIDN